MRSDRGRGSTSDEEPRDPDFLPVQLRPLATLEELGDLDPAALTSWFAALLPHFVGESLAARASVVVARRGRRVDGILLTHDAERVASIFARDAGTAERFLRERTAHSVFAEFQLRPDALPYAVYAIGIPRADRGHRFAHPVRTLRPSDIPQVVRLMHEVYGLVDEAWLRSQPHRGEHGFVVELAGEVRGAAWLSLVGDLGRLHSVSVAPRYRRLGLGTALWQARARFAEESGAARLVTEIAEENVASRRIAEREGMTRVGTIWEHRGAP